MVDGCKKIAQVVVVDLDGTLVTVNTFREYLLFSAKTLVRSLHLPAVAKIMSAMLARKLRWISHSAMKRRVLVATQSLISDDDVDSFVRLLLSKVNVRVLDMLERYRKDGCNILLATAAPQLYACDLAASLHFDGCVATPEVTGPEWCENVGEAKLVSVRNYITGIGGELAAVITDHYDDIPLLRYNQGHNLLVNPSSKTIAALTAADIPFKIL